MNAYSQLVQAAQALEHAEIFEKEEPLSDDEVLAFIETYRPHLDAAREALAHECHVEIEYSEGFFEKHMDDCRPLRNLARGFRTEVLLAEREGRLADAVRAGVNVLDLAGAVRRGGLTTDMLIAVAISGIGIDALRRIRHRLRLDELRLLTSELERIESECEPIAAIITRDDEWERRFPSEEEFHPTKIELPGDENEGELDEELKEAIVELIAHSANRPREERVQDFRDCDNRGLAILRLLTVESAVLAYRLTNDALPESLDVLQPKFLTVVPLDPFLDEPFRYCREGDKFALYSVGPSRQDAGGQMGSWAAVSFTGADLFLDAEDCENEFGCCDGTCEAGDS